MVAGGDAGSLPSDTRVSLSEANLRGVIYADDSGAGTVYNQLYSERKLLDFEPVEAEGRIGF